MGGKYKSLNDCFGDGKSFPHRAHILGPEGDIKYTFVCKKGQSGIYKKIRERDYYDIVYIRPGGGEMSDQDVWLLAKKLGGSVKYESYEEKTKA